MSLSDSRRARHAAERVYGGFRDYRAAFERVTRQARRRFEDRDWPGMRRDSGRRLSLRQEAVEDALGAVRGLAGAQLHDPLLWAGVKAVYSHLCACAHDGELAESFFNSVTRRIFSTVGVDPRTEFVLSDLDAPLPEPTPAVYRRYRAGTLQDLISQALADVPIDAPCEDIVRDAALAGALVRGQLRARGLGEACGLECLSEVFYRGKAAYVVGRLVCGASRNPTATPLVLALLHEPEGIVIDAALCEPDAVGVLFGFTHAYFHVASERPGEVVAFLRGLLPGKRLSELYTALGFNKHGKTELYRELLSALTRGVAPFEIAPGVPGMVMSVFGSPEDDLVVKVIRDRFAPPKDTTPKEVRARYELVFRHDRAGRLIEAHEFEHLRFATSHFAPGCLSALLRDASATVARSGDEVVLKHAYLERRVTPLDQFLKRADPEAASRAVRDFGAAIKDLALSNIFPGDMITKNFGVTRTGRVVFYDYDELCLLEACVFRAIPEAQTPEQELAAEPWYYVGPDDVFPEQWLPFLGLPRALRPEFVRAHGDLLTPLFWTETQARLALGEIIGILPYALEQRLKPERSGRRY